jgi:hypothetical protein
MQNFLQAESRAWITSYGDPTAQLCRLMAPRRQVREMQDAAGLGRGKNQQPAEEVAFYQKASTSSTGC